MKLQVSPYILTKRKKQNVRDSSNIQEGALLRVEENGFWGVADICPKPELGDRSLSDEIQSRGSLFARALNLAQEDLRSRESGASLLSDKRLENNYLLSEFSEAFPELHETKTLKIKCGSDVNRLATWLNSSFNFDVRLRLDFNSCLQTQEFDLFLSLLDKQIIEKIEYIEDPTTYSESWIKWNSLLPLAADFEKQINTEGFIQVYKPSREEINTRARFTLTSAMEHPVGFAHALRIAQQKARGVSGFLTLDYYEATPFDLYFQQNENYVNFSADALRGVGIGMDSDLNKLSWSQI